MLVHRKVLTNLKVPFVFRRSVPLQFLPLFFLICGPTFVDILEHVFADWLWVGGCAHLFSTHTHTSTLVCGLRHFIFVCMYVLFVSRRLPRLIYFAQISEFSGDLRSLLRSSSRRIGPLFRTQKRPRVATRKNGRARQKYTHRHQRTPALTHTRSQVSVFFLHLCFFFCPFLSTFSDSRILSFFRRVTTFNCNYNEQSTLRGAVGAEGA